MRWIQQGRRPTCWPAAASRPAQHCRSWRGLRQTRRSSLAHGPTSRVSQLVGKRLSCVRQKRGRAKRIGRPGGTSHLVLALEEERFHPPRVLVPQLRKRSRLSARTNRNPISHQRGIVNCRG